MLELVLQITWAWVGLPNSEIFAFHTERGVLLFLLYFIGEEVRERVINAKQLIQNGKVNGRAGVSENGTGPPFPHLYNESNHCNCLVMLW